MVEHYTQPYAVVENVVTDASDVQTDANGVCTGATVPIVAGPFASKQRAKQEADVDVDHYTVVSLPPGEYESDSDE